MFCKDKPFQGCLSIKNAPIYSHFVPFRPNGTKWEWFYLQVTPHRPKFATYYIANPKTKVYGKDENN